MSAKTTEQIDKEIQEVMNKFENVECIIGQLAGENGRNRLVHRELRDFAWFVSFMIFSKAEKGADDFDVKFKREYDNFRLGEDRDNAYDLYKWACLYWIYNKELEKTDEYKQLEGII